LRSGQVALDFLDKIDDTYGIDEQGYPCSEIEESVPIPEASLSLFILPLTVSLHFLIVEVASGSTDSFVS